MAYLYATRAISLPVRPSGSDIIGADGRLVANTAGYFAADALATLINAGHPVVKADEDRHDLREAENRVVFLRSLSQSS